MSKNPPDWSTRPARIQVDPSSVHGPDRASATPMGTTYNIWYHSWSGGDVRQVSQQRPTTRVDVALDAGMTRAAEAVRAGTDTTYICLFFARGGCPHGYQCRWWHRLPEPTDRYPVTKDCFGRDLFAQLRDDLGGIGTFTKEHTTLYVGRIDADYPDTDAVLKRYFEPFGHILRIKVLEGRGIGFVTYAWRHEAEFAKEAMANQALDRNEMLNVRWASEDPDPRAREEFKQKALEEIRQRAQMKEMAKKAIEASKEVEEGPVVKKQRLELEGRKEENAAVVEEDVLPPLPEKVGFLSVEALKNIQRMMQSLPAGCSMQLVPGKRNLHDRLDTAQTSLGLISGYESD